MSCIQNIFSLVVVGSLVAYSAEAATGMRITVAEKALQMVNQVEVSALQRDLNGKRFNDVKGSDGSLSWTISDIRVDYLGKMTTSINLYSNGQITWSCSISTITVEADWRARQDLGWLGSVSDDGSIEAKAKTTSLDITLTLSATSGGLGVSLSRCSADVGSVDLDFSGSFLSDLYDAISNMFEGSIRNSLEDAICKLVSEGMKDITADMRDIKTSFPIEVIGIPLTLDNAFTKVDVTSNTISTYHEGAVHWNGLTFHSTDKSAFPASRPSRDIAFDLSEDVVNNLLRAYVDRGNLDGSFNYSRVVQQEWDEFYLTCKKGRNNHCFGNIIRQIASEYPDRVLGMQWEVHSANLNIQMGQITGELTGRVNCSADSVSESLPLFSAEVELNVAFQMKFSGGELSARAVAWGGHATIDRSNIGKVLNQDVLEAVRLFFLPGIQQGVLDILNDFKTHYQLELPRNVFIKTSGLNFYEGIVRVEADLCYKTSSCHATPNDDWVGNNDMPKFTVDDVIPTTTTTTTTTTTPTTTTSRPTDKKPGKGNDTSGQTSALFSVMNLIICSAIYIAITV